MEKRTPAPA